MRPLIFLLSAIVLAAQTPTIEQSLNLKTAASPRISPDGRFVAYIVSETDWENNSFEAQIWMVMTSTGERYQLTHAKKSSTSPRWAPDSKRLGFLSDRDGSRQVHHLAGRRRSHPGHALRRRRHRFPMGPGRTHHRLHLHRRRSQSQKGSHREIRRV